MANKTMKSCPVFLSLALGTVLFCGTIPQAIAADEPNPAADVIIYNAKVLTVDPNFTVAQAIAIKGNQILAIGKEKQIQKFKAFETHLVDAKGCTVMPGLYDNLVDSFDAALSEAKGPSTNFESIAAACEYIRAQAAQKPVGEWITVEHAYPTRLNEGRLPTKAELDAAAPNNPVYWNCGAIAMVNSKALQVSRVTALTTNPPEGEIVLDPVKHTPTGLLRNASTVLKLPRITNSTPIASRRAALKHLYALYNQQGITSIGESQANSLAILLFRDMAESNELTVRINCTFSPTLGTNLDETLAFLDHLTNRFPQQKIPIGPTGVGDDWVRTGPLLARVDGDVMTATAYLRTPWGIGPAYQITEPAYRGRFGDDPESLTAFFKAAADRGWQIAADCTGDAALDQILNCFQKVQFKTDIHQRRFILRHASFQAAEDWERCQQLGVCAEMEPNSLYLDGTALLKMLGEKRLANFEAFKGWFDAKLTIAGGSGHNAGLDPLTSTDPYNPWLGIWVAVARQTAQNDGIFIKEQQLTREDALRFYTINGAKLHFEEAKKGSLEVGKFADLIVLDRDIMKCPVDDIRGTKVQLTMVDGKIVWDANKSKADAFTQAPVGPLASAPK